MDTVAKGLPVPLIFLREKVESGTLELTREVVDGQQRLYTLISYIEPSLLSKSFDPSRDSFDIEKVHNPEMADKSFRQLKEKTRRRILDYQFSVHVLPADAEDTDVLEIFARMNATGVKLNSQELRNARFYGHFKNLMYTLAYEQLQRWKSWSILSESEIARMLEVEDTSDLVITMLSGIYSKNKNIIDKCYKTYEKEFRFGKEVSSRFRTVMDAIDRTLGSFIANTAFSRRTLFYTLFVFCYDLMYGIESRLDRSKRARPLPKKLAQTIRVADQLISEGDLDEETAKALRGATSHIGTRRTRHAFLTKVYNRVKK
jgi:hypothetical protein